MTPAKECPQCGASALEVPFYSDVCTSCFKKTTNKEPEKAMIIQPGETLPPVPTLENIDAWLEQAQQHQGSSKPAKKGKHVRKPAEPVSQVEAAVSVAVDDAAIFQTVNFYQRVGDDWNNVLKDAREEVKYRNSNILIFCHNHIFRAACTGACRQVEK